MATCWESAVLLTSACVVLYVLSSLVFLFLSRSVPCAENGIRLYLFLVIAFSSTLVYSIPHLSFDRPKKNLPDLS